MPTSVRVFLVLEALVWLPYGLYCFLAPGALAASAGVAATTPTGTTELRAMYGGLQAGLGALVALAALRPALVRPALLALLFLGAGLGLARLAGVLLDGGLSGYTAFALGFEAVTAGVAAALLRARADAGG
jgi:hypothetical protein